MALYPFLSSTAATVPFGEKSVKKRMAGNVSEMGRRKDEYGMNEKW